MDLKPARIFPLGDNALTVEFGDEMSEALNNAAIRLAEYFTNAPFPGLVEAVPAVASTTIFYRADRVIAKRNAAQTAFSMVENEVRSALSRLTDIKDDPRRTVEIPVSFAPESALDLAEIADKRGMSVEQVIEIFVGQIYRVYMLGFLPGFAYMGKVDERIAMPRKSAPRLAVPKGSVAIAGRQAGIYPAESPGGWQIIGRTNTELLTDDQTSPCLFRPGDRVRFVRQDA